jgi:serine/threonine-protein kinase HSL1 (negative regulator of Swe1 kinase)
VCSYDPFKASRPQHLVGPSNGYHAKITIHGAETAKSGESSSRYRATSGASSQGTTADRSKLLPPPPKLYASRSSFASTSTRSRASNPYVKATIGHKRGVSFANIRKYSSEEHSRLASNCKRLTAFPRHSNHTEVTDDGGSVLRPVATPLSTRYIRSRKQPPTSQPLLTVAKRGQTSQFWNDDVRQLSTSLAKDCDEAFNRTSAVSNVSEESKVSNGNKLTQKTKRTSLSTRPLPEPPVRTQSVKAELLEARKQAELRKVYGEGDESPTYLDRMVSHIDRLMQPMSPVRYCAGHRTSSAPSEFKKPPTGQLLPSIEESHEKEMSPLRSKELAMYRDRNRRLKARTAPSGRIASAPEPRVLEWNSFQDQFTRLDSLVRDTIRVVDPNSSLSPVKPPAPLVIRKKTSRPAPRPLMSGGIRNDHDTQVHCERPLESFDLRQQYSTDARKDAALGLPKIAESKQDDDSFEYESNASTILRKTSGWFKRSSRSGEGFQAASTVRTSSVQSHSSQGTVQDPYTRPHNSRLDPTALPISPKKKISKLGRWFKKRNSKPDMTIGTSMSKVSKISIRPRKLINLSC